MLMLAKLLAAIGTTAWGLLYIYGMYSAEAWHSLRLKKYLLASLLCSSLALLFVDISTQFRPEASRTMVGMACYALMCIGVVWAYFKPENVEGHLFWGHAYC